MDANDRIFIPRKPRLGLDRPTYAGGRFVSLLLGICALVSFFDLATIEVIGSKK